MSKYDSISYKIWKRVNMDGPPPDHIHGMSGCWLWTGGKNPGGYGCMRSLPGNKTHLAHRVTYTLWNGDIPKGVRVLHQCDVRLCVNPHHLYLGTQAQNVRDREFRNRRTPLSGEYHPARINPSRMSRGEANGNSKLTAETVREIRKLSAIGFAQRKLGAMFGVSQPAIKEIVKRRMWKHID